MSSQFVGVLDRRARRWLVAAVPTSVVVLLLRAAWVSLAGALAQGLGFVQVDVATSIVASAVSVSPLLALLSVVAFASRRSARATITPDHVVVRPLHLRWPLLTIPLVDVVARRTTAHGVILDAPAAVPRALAWLLAPLVPARTAEELARAHAALDAPHVGGPPALARAGRIVGRTEVVAVLLVVLAWVVLVEALRAVIGGVAAASLHALGAALLFALGALALPSRARVHLGAETVSVGGLCVAWTEVTRLAASGPWVTLEAGRRRRAARLFRRDVARAFRAAQERLARDRPGTVVEAATSRWVGRRRLLLGATTIVLGGLAGVIGPLRYFTVEGVVEFQSAGGDDGLSALLVVRRHDATAQLLVLLEGERVPGADYTRSLPLGALAWASMWSSSGPSWAPRTDVEVDVRAGFVRVLGREYPIAVGATHVHVRPDSVTSSVAPLQASALALRDRLASSARAYIFDLRRSLPAPRARFLQEVLDGQTSSRCFDVFGPDARLVAKVDRGRLLTAAVAELGVRFCRPCMPCSLARGPQADLPTLAQVRKALAAIEAGATIAEATAGWPRPGGVSHER